MRGMKPGSPTRPGDDANGRTAMSSVPDWLAHFVPTAVLIVGLFAWQEARFARIDDALDGLRAVLTEHGERLTALKAGQAALRKDIARIEAGQAALREDVARVEAGSIETDKRMARIEGTVVGVLGRPFPESMAQTPEAVGDPDS